VLEWHAMKVGFVQFKPTFGRPKRNLARVAKLLDGVRADLVVLPELFDVGYSFASRTEAFELASPVPGPVTDGLMRLAEAIGGCIVAGVCERAGDALYNSACLVGSSGLVGVYRKAHLFWREKEWFDAGDTGFRVFEVGGAKVGMMICFDWIYPEAARTLALSGAQVICHPANLVLPYCQSAMITRALENRVFIVTANRTGAESRPGCEPLVFTGKSQIVGPRGDVLARAPRTKSAVGIVEIDPEAALDKHATPSNDLFDDRRPELYEITSSKRPKGEKS